ncbi:MAG: hypothetical protein K0U38_06560 [Epsilonproteobacteria bacterium]|nr:hypothetical protein [Campylobacterota bacterium]
MKIAIPVKDESLTFVGNAGHTPKFAIYDMVGTGMFRSFKLNLVIDNPRSDLDHEHDEDDHQCSHGHDDAEHIAEHNKMGVALKDCDYVVVKKACKNTARTMNANGISIVKYAGTAAKSDAILKEMAINFK